MAKQQKPDSFKSKYSELALEKFFDEYIIPWYRERIVSHVEYDKARKEIDLLKNMKKTQKTKKNTTVTDEDVTEVKGLPNNIQRKCDAEGRPRSGSRNMVPAKFIAENERKAAASKNSVNNEAGDTQDLQSLRQQNKELVQKIKYLKNKVSEIRAEAHYELKEKDGQIEKLKMQLNNARGQNDDLSKRLSKLAGDKLRQGNPDLADLSDRYRPTEIGKMFSEVYDNEWSDAFENIPKMEEDKKVGILHGIIMKAFKFCEDKFNEQTEVVRTTLLGLRQGLEEDEAPSQEPRLTEGTCIRTSNILNLLKDVRKEAAMETSANVANQFKTTLQQYVMAFHLKPDEINKTLWKFACKCIELCWLMVICDPPMAISEDRKDKPYDTNIYKPYTRSLRDLKNPVVELPVWPALRLQLGGPLVAKGVAQPGEETQK